MHVCDELLAVNSVFLGFLAHLFLRVVNKRVLAGMIRKAPTGPARMLHFLTPALRNMSTKHRSHGADVSDDAFVSSSPRC